MRRPLPVALAHRRADAALALPALRAVWTPIDASVIPKSKSARTVADALDRDFGGRRHEPDRSSCIDDPAQRRALRRAPGVPRGRPSRAASTTAPTRSTCWRPATPEGETARTVVNEIREDPDVLVGGAAAEFIDQQDAIASSLPLAVRAARGPDLHRAVADDRLDRAADQGDRDERADRRRGARRPHARLPGRALRGPARLHPQRRRRADRLPGRRRARVRALDRLRRVPARPHQGGARRRLPATARRSPSASSAPARS